MTLDWIPVADWVLLLIHIALALACLLDMRISALRTDPVHEVAKAIWAVFVVLGFIVGPVAFLIVRPGGRAAQPSAE
ncbi:MAG: hypothetical protein ACYS8X_13960 [Planctomycetota bacterium]|jgi:hypothetical protein